MNVFNNGSAARKTSATADDKENSAPINAADEGASTKTEQEIQQEIQSLFRQITASVTFLPMLDGNCTFNVLVYADEDSEVPLEWGDSDAKEVKNAEKVKLRSFSTNNHRIDTVVSYRSMVYSKVFFSLTYHQIGRMSILHLDRAVAMRQPIWSFIRQLVKCTCQAVVMSRDQRHHFVSGCIVATYVSRRADQKAETRGAISERSH